MVKGTSPWVSFNYEYSTQQLDLKIKALSQRRAFLLSDSYKLRHPPPLSRMLALASFQLIHCGFYPSVLFESLSEALGLNRFVAMVVRQTCLGWKQISPEALLSRSHICALCGQRAGTSQPAEENMLYWETDRPKAWGKESNVQEAQRPSCLTRVHQLSFYSSFLFHLSCRDVFFGLRIDLKGVNRVHLRAIYWNAVSHCCEDKRKMYWTITVGWAVLQSFTHN